MSFNYVSRLTGRLSERDNTCTEKLRQGGIFDLPPSAARLASDKTTPAKPLPHPKAN